jgi:Xaa-Pro dipeptidase
MAEAYAWPEVDWDGLRRERRERLGDLLRRRGADHVLLSGFDNLRYATDYRTNLTYDSNLDWFAALVAADGTSTLFVPDAGSDEDDPLPGMPWIRRRVAGPSWQSFWEHPGVYTRLLVRELRAAGARRVGVDHLDWHVMDALRAELPDVEFMRLGWDLLDLRKIKSPDEVTLLAAACEVGSRAATAVMDQAQEGMTDRELVRIGIDVTYAHGAEWVSHAVLVAGAASAEVNWLPRGQQLAADDVFFFDFGVYGAGGYCHDFCRTHFLGDPGDRVLDAYAKLLDAFDAGVSMARPGVRGSEITTTINAALAGHGLPPTTYAMGHGIGLRLIERPAIFRADMADADEPLEPGMVICIEPSTHVEVDGRVVGLKEEDQYVVEHGGLRKLTSTRRTRT